MKTNLVKSILSILFLLFSVASFAQQGDRGTPEERATRQTARMKEKLNLSPEQEAAVSEINLKYARQNQSLLQTGGRNIRTARQIQGQMKNKDAELKKVLDNSQFNQYLALKEEMKSELRAGWKQK